MRAKIMINKISRDYIAEASFTGQSLDKCDSCFEGSVTKRTNPKCMVGGLVWRAIVDYVKLRQPITPYPV
jgi:hypothetical protein